MEHKTFSSDNSSPMISSTLVWFLILSLLLSKHGNSGTLLCEQLNKEAGK